MLISITGDARIYGWGVTEKDEPSPVLRQANVAVLPATLCKRYYKNRASDFPQKLICARGYDNETSCVGDSGSPLLSLEPVPRMCGLTSFGDGKNCSEITRPTVYVNIYHYMDWLQQTINEFSSPPLTLTPDLKVDKDPGRAGVGRSDCIASNQFQCANGACIPKSTHCDEVKDCKDGSDEMGCPTIATESLSNTPAATSVPSTPPPSPSIFVPVPSTPSRDETVMATKWGLACGTRSISRTQICDGVLDCEEGDDELVGCHGCRRDEMSCTSTTGEDGHQRHCYKTTDFCYSASASPRSSTNTSCAQVESRNSSLYIVNTFQTCSLHENCEPGQRCISCESHSYCKGICPLKEESKFCLLRERIYDGADDVV